MKLFRVSYKTESDEYLMSAMARGDKHAFDEIYIRYADSLKRYFKRMLWQDELKAEDFVHDLFAKIIRNPAYFDVTRSFKTWVFSVACNMCKNEYQKQAVRKGTALDIEDHYSLSDANANVLKEVEMNQFGIAYEKNLSELKTEHREVFTLRHMDGLSIKEIAEIVQANEGTVKSRLFYATKQLAEKLKEFNPVLE
ncbi:MAG: RNA polymerase sigma factor [Crocinitomicaceae bacterium]|jgi:RNA polymerase sigma-70 factor (ECF subfamily)|nr:RNA polymerase sigma factor [Crocinitomicaceae bacterium]MCF8411052.1 RNA polymerase sigma factor [Crocinitomicaceae bacterium]MCF8444885.1 RNA polymerase sigma factor [Crocinitomicaceae bacterium]